MQFESQNIPYVKIGMNKKIKDSIKMYRQFKYPMKVLLTNFLAVKSKYDLLAAAENPYIYNYKGIEGHEVESGVSVDETLFRFATMSLHDQKPSDVINAAFYANKVRNDYDFELGYLLPLFEKSITEDSRILVVNPSPYVICSLEESKPCGTRYYAVTDNTVAGLYHLQFPEGIFCTFEQLDNVKDIDKVLIINRDLKPERAQLILQSLFCCNEKVSVIGMVPCIWFDNPDNGVYLILKEAHFSPKQILLVDSKATVSVPRKKMIILLEKGDASKIEVTQSLYDTKSRYFSVSDSVQIDADFYLKSKKTILACLKAKEQPKEKKASCYSKAEEYQFSSEISLFYKIYSERKNKFAGVAYYKEIKDIKLKTWGKKLTSDIERGLRADTKDEVVSRLEDIVFNDDVYPFIWNDIKVKYTENRNVISLKTIWFYCWCYISNMKKYNHKYLSQLFCDSEIADVIPQDSTGDTLIRAIAHALKVEVDAIPYSAIEQIDLILKSAVKHRILIHNPLELYIADFTTRATERQQDVRNALVKKHFSSDEEMRIFSAIVGSKNKDGAKLLNCIQKSLLLAGAIRLFTGMAIRETAALKWGDYQPIRGTDAFHFTITKFVDNKGKIVQHSASENWKRFRIVPSAKVLSYLLNERKRYLLNLGIDEEYLMECPIILQNECISDMQNKKIIEHCKPEKISNVCNEIIDKANIPVNEVVLPDAKYDLITDFNRYHGDVFLSNFRHKANHIAYMTMGEINYMIGVNAPDTFSRHYCDYTNDFLQFAVAQKLSRWVSCYEVVITGNETREPTFRIIEGSVEFEIGPFLGGVTVADMIIETTDSSETEISVSSTHGIYVNTTEY